MKTTVCMCTYNGEKYIEEQLASILGQTVKADEVVLCDDHSTDATAKIIYEFIQKNKLQDSWRLIQNQENKGYPGNFYYAMSLCTGDAVFLADQDDIWNGRKMEVMIRLMEQNPQAKVVCCKFALVNENGKKITTLMEPVHSKETANVRMVSIGDVFYKCEWPGMVLAYRNNWFKEVMKEAETARIPHDFLICAKAAEEAGFLQVDECLAYHRRHEHNAGGEEHRIRRLLDKRRKEKEIEEYLKILEAFEQGRVFHTREAQKALEEKTELMKKRYAALQSGKISKVLSVWWHNKSEVRLATFVCDILIVKL